MQRYTGQGHRASSLGLRCPEIYIKLMQHCLCSEKFANCPTQTLPNTNTANSPKLAQQEAGQQVITYPVHAYMHMNCVLRTCSTIRWHGRAPISYIPTGAIAAGGLWRGLLLPSLPLLL